ncbi:putative 2-aminoethylphosphonate ABC transporter permease subunit [Aneurinibacillus sp. REN35]|uniref:putative 2-aminoethylphosphonate ABC transporter permease subunit n=1 Tax=Aneurinibacillus sp. REN35 TaxID=3237286 RepID=UPI0035270E6F
MIRQKNEHEQWIQKALVLIVFVSLFVSIIVPLGVLFRQALVDEAGAFIGFSHIRTYLSSPALVQSLTNTVYVSLMTTVVSVTLAFLYAYAFHRMAMRGKVFFKYVALLPLFAPTMMHGIGLTYLFGNQGVVTTGLFGYFSQGIDIDLYGPIGIILAEIFYTFPQAFLILSVSLAVADYRLYEAADTLGAGRIRKFFTITLPGVKYGLISSAFVVFTLSFTDFGAPKIVGGQYNVLATDIYKYVIGQQNMAMGATVGMILLLPAVVAFIVDRLVEQKQGSFITAKSVSYRIEKKTLRDSLGFIYCLLIASAILILLGAVAMAAVVKVWPYDLTFTLIHFDFTTVAGSDGMTAYRNSVLVAFISAAAGAVITFINAYLIEKSRWMSILRQLSYFISILPMAIPGLVIGLAYVFFFNQPGNPLNWMYGTIWIIILANITHFYSVAFITATSALKKLDKEFELVSESMGVPFYKTFFRVTVPLTLPAIFEIAVYYFVNSMVTISAVVFLYSADFKLASVAIVNMDDAGDIAPAAAMSMLILLTNIAVRAIYEVLTGKLRQRTQIWQKQ